MNLRTLIFVVSLAFCGTAHADPSEFILKDLPQSVGNLIDYAVSQTGAAYHWGGTSPEAGFDCSGFVRYVFDHVEGLDLPHSSRAMSLVGSRIRQANLKPGDLVFFRIFRHRISHVGIYLGNNRFIHAASTSTGEVQISDLADGYWARRFTMARRVLPQD